MLRVVQCMWWVVAHHHLPRNISTPVFTREMEFPNLLRLFCCVEIPGLSKIGYGEYW